MSGTVNRVILVGRLGRDPEIKYTPSGMALAKFSLATDETRKDQQGNRQIQTEWHNLVVWGKQAELAGEYLKKGSLIYVEGRLRTRSWEDTQGGGTKYRTEIVAERFVFLSPRGEATETQEVSKAAGPVASMPEPPDLPQDADDLPF